MTNVLHVIPVGVSLLTAINEGRCNGLDHVLAPEAIAPTPLDKHLVALADHGRLAVDAFLPDPIILANANTECGAEWTSVKIYCADAANASPADADVQQQDSMLFLSTDTGDGLRAATLVAGRYAAQRSVPIRLAGFEGLPVGVPHELGEVILARIPDLDLSGDRPNRPSDDTWRVLGEWGKAIAATCGNAAYRGWDVVFHLNGGYKALVPYLLVMAEGVNTLLRVTDPRDGHIRQPVVRAVTSHESGMPVGHLVDLPVRYLGHRLVEHLRRMSATLSRSERPGREVAEVEGLFATVDGEHYLPNAAGKIMAALL